MSENSSSTIKLLTDEELEIQARNQILLEEQKIKQKALLEKEKNNYKSLKFHEKFVSFGKLLYNIIEDYYQFELEEKKIIPVHESLKKFFDSYMRTIEKNGHSRGFFSYFLKIFINHQTQILNISSNRWLKEGEIVIQLGDGKEGLDVNMFSGIKIELSVIYNLSLELSNRESDEKTKNIRKSYPELIRLYLANLFYIVTFDKEEYETDARIFLKSLENLCGISSNKSLIDKEPWKPKPNNFDLKNFINPESINMLTETISSITGNEIPEEDSAKIKNVFEKLLSGKDGNDIMSSISKQLSQTQMNGGSGQPADIIKSVLQNGELIKSLSNIRKTVDESVSDAALAAESTNLM